MTMTRRTSRGTTLAASAIVCTLAAAAAGAAAPGFYQNAGDSTVYRVTQSDICAVTGPGQLQLLGGTGRVNTAPPDLAGKLKRGKIANCPWPDGFYRRGSERTVRHVQGDSVCAVVGEGQLAILGGSEGSIKVVGDGADLAAGKRDVGACPWPNGFYRYSNGPQVYRIEGATICSVRSEDQLKALGGKGRVKTVGPQAQLPSGKRDLGPCP